MSDILLEHKAIFDSLERMANFVPVLFYWLDTRGVVLGANDIILAEIGGPNGRDSIVGKADHIYYPKDIAEIMIANNNKVLELGKTIEFEEKVVDFHGNVRYFNSTRSPIRDSKGTIIGIVGTSVEITAQKEAKRLELENMQLKLDAQNDLIEAQQSFRKLVGQMIHDIQSPLASMRMFLYSATSFKENERILLRQITDRISDITQDMLNHYKPKATSVPEREAAEPLLLSTTLSEIISEKRFQFKNSGIKIELKIQEQQSDEFAFINVGPRSFKRMISNLINNAVEAFVMVDSESVVTLKYNINNNLVNIIIQDNGKGIPEDLLIKIKNGLAVTYDKIDGHGLGLTQVQNTINLYNGNLKINSNTGKDHGTTITITFPQTEKADWITEEIQFFNNDTVVILDDDHSIHGAWDTKLLNIVEQNPDLKIMHFTNGIDLLKHTFMMSQEEKDKLYLFSDYELLRQQCNGLEIIQKTKIKRATLVTSHYTNPHVRSTAKKQQVKILPKELVPNVLVKIN